MQEDFELLLGKLSLVPIKKKSTRIISGMNYSSRLNWQQSRVVIEFGKSKWGPVAEGSTLSSSGIGTESWRKVHFRFFQIGSRTTTRDFGPDVVYIHLKGKKKKEKRQILGYNSSFFLYSLALDISHLVNI